MNVLWFDEVGAGDIARVGGKGANLGEMTRAGLPVPRGFCVTAGVYQRFLVQAGLWPAIDAALGRRSRSSEDAAEDLERIAAEIGALIKAAPMPDGVDEAIRAAYARFGVPGLPVAVRSSATAEDLPEASFAGQQESYLNVRGEAELIAHVQRCWASLWTARAISYRERNGFDHQHVSLAVVVQEMVEPDVAGVLFTANPLNGRRAEMLVNASWGLGETVVSGRVTPDTFRLSCSNPTRILDQQRGSKELRIVPVPGGGTRAEAVPQPERDVFCLEPPSLNELAALGLRVEAHYGAPQDIEWAAARGRLYLLQARPITALENAPLATEPTAAPARPLSKTERTIRDDILEHYPEPPYPLDYEAVTRGYEQLQDAMRQAGLRVPPAESLIRIDELGLPAVTPVAPSPTPRLLLLPWTLARMLRRDPSRWERELSRPIAERSKAIRAVKLDGLDGPQLSAHIASALDLSVEIGRIRFAEFVLPMVLRGALLRLLVRLGGGPKETAETDLLSGLEYRTAIIDRALARLAKIAASDPVTSKTLAETPSEQVLEALGQSEAGRSFLGELRGFLAEHGARTMKAYVPFSSRSWSEDPTLVLATIAAMARSDVDASEEARRAAAARFGELVANVTARLKFFGLHRLFQRQLEQFRVGHVAREATLYAIEESFELLRRAAAEAGARLVKLGALRSADDVRLLTRDELSAALRGERSAAETRRVAVARQAARPRAAASWRGEAEPLLDEGDLKGLAGSPGLAGGVVRVVREPSEFRKLRRGDVLVCPYTDPAWTPLFSLAAAVVSDTGGPLSHAAIVAREYGIPAVLGTGAATLRLRDGDRVTVDGSRGLVRVEAARTEEVAATAGAAA